MIFRNILLSTIIALASYNAVAEQVPAGVWQQTSSTAGDCSNCEIKITLVSPHIIQISANNGWIGYAYYIRRDDKYTGAFQWQAGNGGAYENVVFVVEMTYEGKTLSFDAKSNPLSFSATFRKK
ncbi:MAG: hypothetical protein ACTS8S_01330 [Giesbergeria sp.]